MAKAEDEGLNLTDYLPPVLGSFADDGSDAKGDFGQLSRHELAVSAMALRYAKHAYSGRIIPNRLSGYYDIEPPVLDPCGGAEGNGNAGYGRTSIWPRSIRKHLSMRNSKPPMQNLRQTRLPTPMNLFLPAPW